MTERWRKNPWDQRSDETAQQHQERMAEWNLTGGGQRPDERAHEYDARLAELRLTGGQRSDERAHEYDARSRNLEQARDMQKKPDESWTAFEVRRSNVSDGLGENHGRYPDLD